MVRVVPPGPPRCWAQAPGSGLGRTGGRTVQLPAAQQLLVTRSVRSTLQPPLTVQARVTAVGNAGAELALVWQDMAETHDDKTGPAIARWESCHDGPMTDSVAILAP